MASAVVPEVVLPPQEFVAFSGFWRRLAALLIDWLVLGAIGFAIGLASSGLFVQLGPWGRLVGFAIALPYFAAMNSSRFNGQTLGKRAMRIRVVDGSGAAVSSERSLVRALILLVPFFLNNAQIPVAERIPIISTAIALIVFGTGSAIAYLVVFNRPTRQSLHDRVTGTYVVKVLPRGPVSAPPFWSKHWVVIAALNLALFAAAWVLVLKVGHLEEMVPIQQAVYDTGRFHSVSMNRSVVYGSKTVTTLTVTVWAKDPSDPQRQVHDIARLILQKDPTALKSDVLMVNMTYGFDIGIASGWRSWFEDRPPAEWVETLQKEQEAPR